MIGVDEVAHQVLYTCSVLKFYDVENQATLKQTDHFRCNYIEWDPSGRYACTAVSQPVSGSHWKAQMDNGYQLFSFQASESPPVGRAHIFCEVDWRSPPPLYDEWGPPSHDF